MFADRQRAVCALADIAAACSTPSVVCDTVQTGERCALQARRMPHTALEPAYTINDLRGDIEIRDYAPYLVAEMFIGVRADRAGTLASPILAGYIDGKNKEAKTFAMRAPMTQTPNSGGYLVHFVLPSEVTLSSAPEPDDPRVCIRDVPARRVAVIRYSGPWSALNYAQHLARLTNAMATAGMRGSGEPVFSRYNSAWTPGFLRRNEIWFALR